MTSLGDPNTWRLRTSDGIPYRVLGFTGGFSFERGSAEVKVLIPGSRLEDFVSELLPPPRNVGYLSIPQSVSLPGLPTMIVRDITFKSFDDGLPIDPFGFDTAGAASYYNVLELTVSYDTQINKKEPDEHDPFSFLEISAQAGGEFIHIPSSTAHWLELDEDAEVDSDEDPSTSWMDDPKAALLNEESAVVDDGLLGTTSATKKPAREPNLPATVVVPTTKWNVSWPQIPYEVFNDVMVSRLRIMLGRVNQTTMPILKNAVKETVLFLGYDYKENYTWRQGLIGRPPISLEMHFIEKRVVWKGRIHGHNSFWRKDKGWTRLYIDDENHTVYRRWDFNQLFQV